MNTDINKTLETLDNPTITTAMSSLTQDELKSVWDAFSGEYIKLTNWLKEAYPKRAQGKVSKQEYQENHKRHLYLDRILGNARICSNVWFTF